MLPIRGVSKEESIKINLAVAVSKDIRDKVIGIVKSIFSCGDFGSLVKILDDYYTHIPQSYLRKYEASMVSKKYCDLLSLKLVGQFDKGAIIEYVELKQDIESEEFKEKLSMYFKAEAYLDSQMEVMCSGKSSDEGKLEAARNCMNYVQPFMTDYEKLLCRQMILLSGDDPYFYRWKCESLGMYQTAMDTKAEFERIFSSESCRSEDGCLIVLDADEEV